MKTYFSTLLTANQTQTVSASSTCGVTQIMQGAPIMVLNPRYQGPCRIPAARRWPLSAVRRAASWSTPAVRPRWLCGSSGVIDTHLGGPNFTGSDVGTYGGPTTAPGASTGCYGTNGNTGLPAGFDGGTTGHWDWPASPVAGSLTPVPAAAGMKTVTPLTKSTHNGETVTLYIPAAAETDGCPDQSPPTTSATRQH